MTLSLDLVPGMTTTREAIAAAYGCGIFQGIEPADQAGKVFVFSDPSAGEEYGYTFDGRAEDDEFGPLYLYTGAGANGPQKPSGRNGSLLSHMEKEREVHLFVANGRVPGGKAMQQRYIGQMVVDPIRPYEVRRGPGRDGVMRDVLVFRLRPAAGTTPAWTEADNLAEARKGAIEFTKPVLPPAEPVALPRQQGARVKEPERHHTSETVADVLAGPRKVFRREGRLVQEFAAHLEAMGHEIHSFQITIAGEPGALIPDLYDATDHVLYEAKGLTTRHNVRMAIGQLADYRRHVPRREELRVAVLLPDEPTSDVRDLLHEEGVELIYQTEEGFAAG
ncbi:hypothetical protein [Streptomyces alkaliterrae]|uniref:ScoMcrA-like SRA domain-containing protein n=1 Tax=Streptomyces alkaliterrae TaxID=2213162 RepID=A0A5P0Z033_9ACTN|nr:hypothetical protein [Streptomyces alkaliterrae]MBB1261181.1 hypothetical protein [Streptomyces alkaliterrae]MQS04729.1 hypothetical protein [Streptomyces alkaliterrae]